MLDTGNPLAGRRIMLVEDEYVIARDMARAFETKGAEIVGPVATVDAALQMLSCGAAPDGVVLDIKLRDGSSYPVADVLVRRQIPFVFATGYGHPDIPPRFAHAPYCEKPVDPARVQQLLIAAIRDAGTKAT